MEGKGGKWKGKERKGFSTKEKGWGEIEKQAGKDRETEKALRNNGNVYSEQEGRSIGRERKRKRRKERERENRKYCRKMEKCGGKLSL